MWLEAVFGDEPIPAFEINSKTIEVLSSLVDINTQRDQDTRLLLKDLEQKRDEYASEGEVISELNFPVWVTWN